NVTAVCNVSVAVACPTPTVNFTHCFCPVFTWAQHCYTPGCTAECRFTQECPVTPGCGPGPGPIAQPAATVACPTHFGPCTPPTHCGWCTPQTCRPLLCAATEILTPCGPCNITHACNTPGCGTHACFEGPIAQAAGGVLGGPISAVCPITNL